MLDPRLECRCSNRQIASARRAKPVDSVELEVVEHRLGRLLPRVLEVDPLTQSAALPGSVESDDCEAQLGQRQQECVELFDERIVAAVEHERASLLALRLYSKSRQVSARIRNLDAFVPGDPLHSKRPVTREVVVESVADIAGGKIELRTVVVRGGIKPPLFGFRALCESHPDSVPAFVVLDLWRDSADLLDPRLRRTVEQGPVEGVVHARVGQHVEVRHFDLLRFGSSRCGRPW